MLVTYRYMFWMADSAAGGDGGTDYNQFSLNSNTAGTAAQWLVYNAGTYGTTGEVALMCDNDVWCHLSASASPAGTYTLRRYNPDNDDHAEFFAYNKQPPNPNAIEYKYAAVGCHININGVRQCVNGDLRDVRFYEHAPLSALDVEKMRG